MLYKKYQDLSVQNAQRLLCWAIAAYIIVFCAWTCLRFYSFYYYDFDLAIHDQVMWNIIHGRTFNSILGVNFLGNHIHFISFLIAPLYWVFPHPLTLLFLQTAALGVGALPLYALARMVVGHRLALIVALVYLLYPGLGYTNLFEFHPPALAVPLLLGMLYYFYKGQKGLFVLFMALSLLCQENIPLLVAALGVYALVTRRGLWWGLVPLITGAVYFIICVKVLLPYFNPNTIQFISIYKTILAHPQQIGAVVLGPSRLKYLMEFFLGFSFVPLLSPTALLPAIPLFAQHLLSSRASELSLYYHYTAELIPPVSVAFVFGIAKMRGWGLFRQNEGRLALFLLTMALASTAALGPHFNFSKEWSLLQLDKRDAQKEALIRQVPPDASVVATFELLSHLTHREHLYSFHHVYWGFYTLSDKPYQLPDDVEYALIDFKDRLTFQGFYRPDGDARIKDFLRQGWTLKRSYGTMALFQKL